jgi:diadenosine tetraphosphatase ApaH/serine/threonine PP2A family protein phosphatase
MRIAILSDVHSNYEALTSMRKVLNGERIDRWVCLGDVVGYGASPQECCDIIRDLCEVTLLGNHDAAVAGRMDYTFYYEAARQALDWSATHISQGNLSWLKALPYTYQIGDVGFSHGSPIDPEAYEYIFALEQAKELIPFTQDLPQITFIGHSHLCKAFAIGPTDVADVAAPEFTLKAGYKYIVSVGSVGQPRDYDNRSCCMIYDTDTFTARYVRVEYDIDASAAKIFKANLAKNFGKRLRLGV